MKRLKTFFAHRGAVPAACYILAVAVWLMLSLAHAGSDALAKAQGRMTEQIIPVQNWQLVGLEPAEEQATAESALTLTTTNGDPQMILEDVSGQVVRTLSYTVTFDGDAREMCLYYTTKVGEDYSQDRRVFPQNLGNGRYLYTLPRTSIAALRLDPCSPDENKTVDLTFAPATLTLNAASTLPAWWQYLVPTCIKPSASSSTPPCARRRSAWFVPSLQRRNRRNSKQKWEIRSQTVSPIFNLKFFWFFFFQEKGQIRSPSARAGCGR